MNGNLIMTLLNNSNFYLVILDKKMNIRFINQTLANRLGFESMKELLGKCWLEFIPEKNKETIKTVHFSVLFRKNDDYSEYTNTVLNKDGAEFQVQWFNTLINHDTHWSLSLGLAQDKSIEVTSETIREDFRARIESDKTFIRSLKDYVNEISDKFKLIRTCDLPRETENTF
jgi:PAS domain S-box-containing protein